MSSRRRTSASSTRCTSRCAGATRCEFALRFPEAFPDLGFGGTAELIAEGDYVVGRWKGGGTHTGPAFDDLPVGSLAASAGPRGGITRTAGVQGGVGVTA